MKTTEYKAITVTADEGDTLYDFWKALGEIDGGGWFVQGTLRIIQPIPE